MSKFSSKPVLLLIATVVSVCALIFTEPSAYAGLFDSAKNQTCAGAQLQDVGDCNAVDTGGIDKTIKAIIDILSIIVGIVAVIMIIINGLKFITSGGDSNKVGSAKSGVIYAIVGLIIVVIAQFVVRFVIGSV